MNVMFSILILLVPLILKIEAENQQCYFNNSSPYVHFSTLTSYFTSRGSEIFVPESCEPIFIWGLLRHGTRYPEPDFFPSIQELHTTKNEIIQNHRNGRGKLCDQDLRNLEKWKNNLTADMELELAPQGIKDEIFIAQKFKEKFPKLLSFPSTKFVFQSTKHNRTKATALAFTNEIFGTNYTSTQGNNITENDVLLQLAEHCPRYTMEIKKNSILNEKTLFENSAEIKKLIDEISIRLGYLKPLSFDLIQAMRDSCAYENAWNLYSRPAFCASFSSHDLKVLEYLHDLDRYYKRGYGNPITKKMGCTLVRDMMTSLSDAATNSKYKGKFLFAHSETITPAITKLGLYQDEEPLRHDNYNKMIEQRKWRLSEFDSFAANIITVLYNCTTQNRTSIKAAIYLNERQGIFPQCGSSLCELDQLKQIFGDVFDENRCNAKFCEVTESSTTSAGSLLDFTLLGLIISFFVTRTCN